MTCNEVDVCIDDIAAGDEASAAVTAHVATCHRCATALANAQAIERGLRELAAPEMPRDFALAVMARIRRDRWRSEQVVDWAFNVAVALGVCLIVGGLGGLAWATGLISIGGDLVSVLAQGSPQLFSRLVAESQTIVLAGLLLSAAIALWWWAENDSLI